MATLRIPNSEFTVLRKIVELEDSVFSSLVKAIEETDTKFIPGDFASLLAPKVPSIKPDDLKHIFKTVYSLYLIMDNRSKSPETIGNDLKETIETQTPKTFPVEKTGLLGTRIQKLLSIGKGLALASKAFDVLTDQDRLFCGVKVLSDVRPVFQESRDSITAATISAAIIIHNLRIAYHENGEHKEFSVAMNPDDVLKIKMAIERAENKTKTLKAFIQKTGISYFEDKEG